MCLDPWTTLRRISSTKQVPEMKHRYSCHYAFTLQNLPKEFVISSVCRRLTLRSNFEIHLQSPHLLRNAVESSHVTHVTPVQWMTPYVALRHSLVSEHGEGGTGRRENKGCILWRQVSRIWPLSLMASPLVRFKKKNNWRRPTNKPAEKETKLYNSIKCREGRIVSVHAIKT